MGRTPPFFRGRKVKVSGVTFRRLPARTSSICAAYFLPLLRRDPVVLLLDPRLVPKLVRPEDAQVRRGGFAEELCFLEQTYVLHLVPGYLIPSIGDGRLRIERIAQIDDGQPRGYSLST